MDGASWQDRPPARPLVDEDGVNWLLPWLAPFFGWPWYERIANDNEEAGA